ncbi:hypothetical protein ASPZODRAFT_76724 [Penicilliopsis zonata CBS 506.65]|uniref:Rhodopsin domain-containing protein n=1 Tax=Penicilliopsis zonata CBS 506.65 TaxID=1073090 RepID=A0A1L9S5L2_9EURO|nr:hypothetical protein ASPZODRAFT_76724 [Penicilliopsis zonata CBS 506.65]OJJ42456.1 hypothetical protein ASPZODRAFT_76724 [Penicilliopsis zonata CBS 506.65]
MATPVFTAPAGQTSNFVDPPTNGTRFIAVNGAFLFLSVLMVSMRTWTRLFIVHSFGIDDYIMVIALILSAVLSAVTLEMLKWGLGRHMWDVPFDWYTPTYLKLDVISATIYCAATGCVKVSVLLFYLRIFPSRKFHLAVWVIIFIATGYNVASVFVNLLGCHPVSAVWDLSIRTATCINRSAFYFANAGLGIFTDFATVLVPVPWLRRLQVPLRQKVAIGCILTMGCFVGIVSCIRLATLFVLENTSDLTWTTVNPLLWSVIELNLGIAGGCMTALRPFVRQYFPRLLGLTSRGQKDYSNSRSRSRSHSHPLQSLPSASRPDFTGNKTQYSTTLHAGDNSSEEHILSGPSSGVLKGIVRTVEFDVKNDE